MKTEMEMDVLIRSRISADGRTLRVAPGVELKVDGDMIATDLPPDMGDEVFAAVMLFATEADRREFAELFADDEAMHVREL